MTRRTCITALVAFMVPIALLAAPAAADNGIPPEILGILSPDATIDPGETMTITVQTAGVDDGASASLSGDGLSADVSAQRGSRLRLDVTAELTASPGVRDLTITNPDGLSDTYAGAIAVAGDAAAGSGDVTGRVFEDDDGDGVQDGGESGFAGVDVSVTDALGGVWSVVTDGNGDFVVVGVPVGDATVVVASPAGHVVTTDNQVQSVTVVEDATAATASVGIHQAEPGGQGGTGGPLPGVYAPGDVHFVFDARSLDLTDGDPVMSWVDDATGIELTTPGSEDSPTYVAVEGFDGVPSVEFDGVDDTLHAAFGELDTGDFVYHAVLETQTYATRTAIMSRHSAGDIETKNVLGYDDYDERGRTLRNQPAWVVMSGPDGTQAQHYHPILSTLTGDARNSPTDVVTGHANRTIITYSVRDSGQIRFWDRQDQLLDVFMAAPGNNLDVGFRLGSREDGTSYGHFRIAFLMAVDESDYTDQELMAAAEELAEWFNVPGF
jgi:hypothetical protein